MVIRSYKPSSGANVPYKGFTKGSEHGPFRLRLLGKRQAEFKVDSEVGFVGVPSSSSGLFSSKATQLSADSRCEEAG